MVIMLRNSLFSVRDGKELPYCTVFMIHNGEDIILSIIFHKMAGVKVKLHSRVSFKSCA